MACSLSFFINSTHTISIIYLPTLAFSRLSFLRERERESDIFAQNHGRSVFPIEENVQFFLFYLYGIDEHVAGAR